MRGVAWRRDNVACALRGCAGRGVRMHHPVVVVATSGSSAGGFKRTKQRCGRARAVFGALSRSLMPEFQINPGFTEGVW